MPLIYDSSEDTSSLEQSKKPSQEQNKELTEVEESEMSSKVFDSCQNMLAPDKSDNELKTMKQLKKAMRQKVRQEMSDQKYGASMRDLFDHTTGKGPS